MGATVGAMQPALDAAAAKLAEPHLGPQPLLKTQHWIQVVCPTIVFSGAENEVQKLGRQAGGWRKRCAAGFSHAA